MQDETNKTIKKSTIQDELHLVYGFSKKESKTALESLLTITKEHLLKKHTVVFKNYGKLVARFKKGGRPVRNPKNISEEYVMPDTATVVLSSLKREQEHRINTSDLVQELTEKLENAELAEACIQSFIDKLTLTKQGDFRMEIRGFGVFSANWLEPRIGRNPRTGDEVEVLGRYNPHFKVGKPLKKAVCEVFLGLN